jgi:hypothetical protein
MLLRIEVFDLDYTYYLKAVEAYGIDSEEARAMAHK